MKDAVEEYLAFKNRNRHSVKFDKDFLIGGYMQEFHEALEPFLYQLGKHLVECDPNTGKTLQHMNEMYERRFG